MHPPDPRKPDPGPTVQLSKLGGHLVSGLLTLLTLAALLVSWRGGSDTLLLASAAGWAIYGLIAFMIRAGDLLPDAVARLFMNVGVTSAADGFSVIETMVARGAYVAAADAYLERARDPLVAAEAMVRRAALLAGPIGEPSAAVEELEAFRGREDLSPAEDLSIGRALIGLCEGTLDDPGRAMVELRRLIDRHPTAPDADRLRLHLSALRADRFHPPEPAQPSR